MRPSTSSAAASDAPTARWTRNHRLLLALVVLIGFARGLFWVVAIEVWNPIDEMAHFGYIASIAGGGGVPVVGEDLLPAEVLLLAKDSRTYGFRSAPVRPEPTDEQWGASAHQYEGVQPPLYYALMAPVYRLARGEGLFAAVMAVRVATLMLSLLAVPLTALLARELFPHWPLVWIGAPALLVTLGGVNGVSAYVTNDALVLPLAAGVLFTAARAWRRGPHLGQAVAVGALGGLAFLTRSNTVVLAPLVAAALVGAAWRHRTPVRRLIAWGAIAGGLGLLLGLPWVAWTRQAYPGTTVIAEFSRLVGPIVGAAPSTLAGLLAHLKDATRGWFDFEVNSPWLGGFFLGAIAVCAVTLGAGLAGSWRDRDRSTALALLWLAAAAPAAAIGMVLIIQLVLDGNGRVVGRYLLLTLPALAVLVAAGWRALLPSRWAAVAVAVVAAASVTGGARIERAYVDAVYTSDTPGALAPVVDQSWHDGWLPAPMIGVRPSCPVRTVTLTFLQPPPAALGVGAETAALTEVTPLYAGASYGLYTLPRPLAAPFTLSVLDGAAIGVSGSERSAALAIPGAVGDPVARLACAVDDPQALRFGQLHPLAARGLRYGTLKAAPLLWPLLAWSVAAVLLLRAAISSPASAAPRAQSAAAPAPQRPGSLALGRWPARWRRPPRRSHRCGPAPARPSCPARRRS